MKRSVRVGLTGKFGSGKSTLAALMQEAGLTVLNTDALAKQLMQEDESVRKAIIQLLGQAAYPNGELDRSFVAREIFSDVNKKDALESIVHPAVRERIEAAFEAAPSGHVVVVESALILHSDLYLAFDYIVLVESTEDAVRARLKGRFEDEDIDRRLIQQHYDSVSKEEVDITIENNGSVEQFQKRAAGVILLLKILSTAELPALPIHQMPEEELPEDLSDELPEDPSKGLSA